MSDLTDLDKRTAILEMELQNMKLAVEKIDTRLEDSLKATLEVKERLDRQNGAIPHMSETLKLILSEQKQISSQLAVNDIKDAGSQVKIKIMWGIIVILGSSLAMFGLNLLQDLLQK